MKKLILALSLLSLVASPAFAAYKDAPNVSRATGTLAVANGGTGQKASHLSALQKKAAAVANSNLDVNTPSASASTITTATSWTTTGFTNLTPSSGGWVASFTGNTTAGSNVVTNVSSTSGLVDNDQMPIVENVSNSAFPANIPHDAKLTAIGSTTITLSKPATGTATGITIKAYTDKVRVIGGFPGNYNGNFRGWSGTVGNAVNPPTAKNAGSASYGVEFVTDAANFQGAGYAVVFKLYNNASPIQSYRIAIDGVYQTALQQPLAGNSDNYVQVVFATKGKHTIRIETNGTPLLQGIYLPTGADAWQPKDASRVTASIFSDSWGAGGSFWGFDSFFSRVCKRAGISCINQSVSGTGYVATGATNYNWADANRKSDTGFGSFDLVFVFGSTNDTGSATATIQANAETLYRGIRTASPSATLVVSGFPATNSITTTTSSDKEGGEYAAFQAFQTWELSTYGRNNSFFIPFSTDVDGAWLNSSNITYAGGGYINYASFNGTSVSGSNVLTVNSLTSGGLEVGQELNGSSYFPAGTYVVSLGTGTGQAGTYNMSANATSSATAAMTAGDGSHPSMAGTAYIADKFYNKLMDVLQNNVSF